MAISRRMLLVGGGLIVQALAVRPAEACSLVGKRKPVGYSDRACRRSLGALIALINAAPALSDEEVSARASELSVRFDENVSDPIVNYPNGSIEDVDLIRAWSTAAGKRDQSPLVLREVNALKGENGIALYQFTLRRDLYHAEVTEAEAADDSCGMAAAAFYGREEASYLGLFINNKLREVSAFDAWLRKL